MNNSEILLDKADALLLRLRSSTEAEFPVLTEIVELTGPRAGEREPHPLPKHTKPVTDLAKDEFCENLRAQLMQSLERRLKRQTDEALLVRLRPEVELALEIMLKRLVDELRKEILLDIEKILADVIDTEFRASLRTRT